MSKSPKIAFIGAGSTIFMKHIICDVLQRDAMSGAHVALVDIDPVRLAQSVKIADQMVTTLDVPAKITSHLKQREALDGADFVIVTFQIGGYDPCTITDFEIPKKFGLEQTIADTLGIGGIMRGVRTVPHLWSICDDMMDLCPEATLLQYVNPMSINIWAITEKYPEIKVVGLCHSIQYTVKALATDLGLEESEIRFDCSGINHIAFFSKFEQIMEDGSYRDLYPALQAGYAEGRFPTDESMESPRCKNFVRYEMMKRLGYFVTESSEHFAEYVPWFIKKGREDLIEKFQISIDEYPKRCIEQAAGWDQQAKDLEGGAPMDLEPSNEFASDIIESIWTGKPSVIYGNVANKGMIENLPDGCAVEVACLVDRNGVQPVAVGKVEPHLAAIMQSHVSVHGLVVDALMTENPDRIYHAAIMDPHTAAELDLEQIEQMVNEMRAAHGEWLPKWAQLPAVSKEV